ncbi:MAG: hypothetical protein ABR583_05395 [Gaiellaceae bacterium]
MQNHARKIAAGTVAVLAIAGGGAAFAATKGTSAEQESEAVVSDAAEELGVTPAALTSALKKALSNRVDTAVEAGRLTQEQGDELKERIEAGDVPLAGLGPVMGPRHGPGGHHAGLAAAATYLGMTEAELRTALESGKTLAELAKARDKTVDGLVGAMVDDARAELDAAVNAGRLTEEQRDRIAGDLEEHITALVNGDLPAHPSGPPPNLDRAPFAGPPAAA